MAAKHAVLRLVIEEPGYGYELAQRLGRRCESWRWTPTVVYSALDGLTDEGLVRVLGEKPTAGQERAARRMLYEATPEGLDYFQGWMHAATPLKASRQDLELKIVLADTDELPRLIEMTRAQEGVCIDRLQTLSDEADPVGRGVEFSWRDIGDKLIRDIEIHQLKERVEWLQEVRTTIKLFLERTAGPAHGRR
jgi:DNA-binding PadR family transcriptional regulator